MKMNNRIDLSGKSSWISLLPIAFFAAGLFSACIKEDNSDCAVPFRFEYDWRNQVEPDACRGQVHLRLYDGNGTCNPFDCSREGAEITLDAIPYEVLTYNNRLEGLEYSGQEYTHTAQATVREVATPDLVAQALADNPPAEPLIGQANGFLYYDSIPRITPLVNGENHALLVPEPVGYLIRFKQNLTGPSASQVAGLEATLSGIVPQVWLATGGRTEAPTRTALARTEYADPVYLSTLYVFGVDGADNRFKVYVDVDDIDSGPVIIDKDLTDIIREAIEKNEEEGAPPIIDFELNIEIDHNSLRPGQITVVGWEDVEGGGGEM